MDPFILALLMLGVVGIGIAAVTISSADNIGLWSALKRLFSLKTGE